MNKYQPHVFVLPEDDANRKLANGFLLGPSLLSQRIKVLEVAGGWTQVLEQFRSKEIRKMERYVNRFMVLLIDFDGQEDRLIQAKAVIPTHLANRVFVLGVWTEPEDLKHRLEEIGTALAKDCCDGTSQAWDHELLKHNAAEVARLRELVRPILF